MIIVSNETSKIASGKAEKFNLTPIVRQTRFAGRT
jgi:hypothetical protein